MPRFLVLHGTVSGKGPGSIVVLPASMSVHATALKQLPDEDPAPVADTAPVPVPAVEVEAAPVPPLTSAPAEHQPRRKKGKHQP